MVSQPGSAPTSSPERRGYRGLAKARPTLRLVRDRDAKPPAKIAPAIVVAIPEEERPKNPRGRPRRLVLRPERESATQRLERISNRVEYRRELQALEALRPKTRSECAPRRLALVSHLEEGDERRVHAPCPWVRCRFHLHTDVAPDGSITFIGGDLSRTCVLDVVDANPDGLTREEIATVAGHTDERTRIVERRLEKKIREMRDREDFEDVDDCATHAIERASLYG